MPAEMTDASDGILTLKVSGRLAESELAAVQRQTAATIRTQGRVRILVLAVAFEGWDRGGGWDDLTLQAEADPHVEKMAIVGDKRWEELALIFTAKGQRPFPIEYFAQDDLAHARAWLDTP